MRRPSPIVVVLAGLAGQACGAGRDDGGVSGSMSVTATTAATDGVGSTSAPDGATGETTTSPATGDDTGGPKLDVGTNVDLGQPEIPGTIPTTCAAAERFETTVGCSFYAVDLDNYTPWDDTDWGVAVANVQDAVAAEVVVEVKEAGAWQTVAGPVTIEAKDLELLTLPGRNLDGSGVMAGGAYRITADVPVIAYQFGPLANDGSSGWASADASLLHPAASWDTLHQLVGVGVTNHMLPEQAAYVTVVARTDGTVVTVTPSVATLAGPGVAAGAPGVPFDVALDEGDTMEVATLTLGASLTGTRVSSNDAHPIGVFTGHECANIPADVYACDHLEEQMPGLRRWGTSFVGARPPVRNVATPETSLWQIYASEDATTVNLTALPGVTGLPASPLTLDSGDLVEFYAAGPVDAPGDLLVEADKPIAVANYMTSQNSVGMGATGDPAMVLLPPTEQWLPRYVVLVPTAWPTDVLVLTRTEGTAVAVDGTPVDDGEFITAGGGYEVARIVVPDGVYLLEADDPFGVVVTGMHDTGSYAYVGGLSTAVINPTPPEG